ncbi:GPI transamidase component PIG-S [Centruroides vittatus]|uniref:GPI transamidase component PIG-S n=1 Tax=Centruroides vittatus TaxID=120091 RepID=UPI00350F56EB
MGIFFVFVIIGVPLWWKTTEVYRVTLPYSEIEKLPFLEVVHSVPVTLIIADKSIAQIRLKQSLIEANSDSGNQLKVKYHLTLRDISKEEENILNECQSISEFSKNVYQNGMEPGIGSLQIFILSEKSHLGIFETLVDVHRTSFCVNKYAEEEKLAADISKLLKNVLVKDDILKTVFISTENKERKQPDKESMRSLSATATFDITFNLIVPQPSIDDVHWNIVQAVDEYVKPFLDKLSILGNVNVNSQLHYMTFLNIQTKTNSRTGEHILEFDHLPSIINPIEAKLGSHVSVNPSLNFVIYIPSQAQSPLQIYDEKGSQVDTNAFLSPRWGGFLIYNVPPLKENATLPRRIDIDMKKVMEVFISQLQLLLGLPNPVKDDKIRVIQSSVCTDWEVDFLIRRRTQEQLSVAISSLYSLGQLLGTISNIVIRDDVGNKVYASVDFIKDSLTSLKDGRLEQSYLQAKHAFMLSEEAFFDPSLLALLYFPDDQKYAIYIPLFLPVGIPVLLSLRFLPRCFDREGKTQKRKKND